MFIDSLYYIYNIKIIFIEFILIVICHYCNYCHYNVLRYGKCFCKYNFFYIFASKNYGVIVLHSQAVSKRESGENPELYP